MGPQSLISSSIHESKGELIERNERDWWVGRQAQVAQLFFADSNEFNKLFIPKREKLVDSCCGGRRRRASGAPRGQQPRGKPIQQQYNFIRPPKRDWNWLIAEMEWCSLSLILFHWGLPAFAFFFKEKTSQPNSIHLFIQSINDWKDELVGWLKLKNEAAPFSLFVVGYARGAAWLHSTIPEELSSFMLSFPLHQSLIKERE